MKTLPPKMIRIGICAVVILLLGNPVADFLDLKYWQPVIWDSILSVYAYQQLGSSADVLFFGSSRTGTNVRPKIIEDEYQNQTGRQIMAYSLGQQGVNAISAEWMLRDTMVKNGLPELVVLELAPSAVNTNREFYRDLEWYCSTSDMIGMAPDLFKGNRIVAASKGQLRGWSSLLSWVIQRPGSQRSQEQLAKFVEEGGFIFEPKGTVADLSAEMYAGALRWATVRGRETGWANYEIGGPPVEAVEAIIDVCRRGGSRLTLVNPPVHPDYHATFDKSGLAQFHRFIEDLEETHAVRFYDFDTPEARRFLELTDAEYKDFTHLSSEGAERCSRERARRVLLEELSFSSEN